MQALENSSAFYAAVVGNPLCTTKDYFSLICNPRTSPVLLQLQLLRAQDNSLQSSAAAGVLCDPKVSAAAGNNEPYSNSLTRPGHVDAAPGKHSHGLLGSVALQRTERVARCPLAAQTASSKAVEDEFEPAEEACTPQTNQSHTRQHDALQLPHCTGNLLQFSLWSNLSDSRGQKKDGDHNKAAGSTAADSPYQELSWLQDLHVLQQQASKHL